VHLVGFTIEVYVATLSITGTGILGLASATAVWKPHVKHCNHFEPRTHWKCREFKWRPLLCTFLGCDCRWLGIVNACCMLTVTDVRCKRVNGYLKHFWKPPHIVPCRGFHVLWTSFTSSTWQPLSRLFVWRKSEGWHDRCVREWWVCKSQSTVLSELLSHQQRADWGVVME
jgi:hypothetical protein